MTTVRTAAVAGSFYPGDERRLSTMVDGLVSEAKARPVEGSLAALVVPHAGYVYSGPIAASAYALLKSLPKKPTRIALFGPSHYVGFNGLALPESQATETPLGVVPLDEESVRVASKFSQVFRSDMAHQREHSLEVQLPFLQRLLPKVPVTPFAIGRAKPEEVSEVMRALAELPGTLLVVSTDLSHYLSWNEAKQLDQRTAEAVLKREPKAIASEQACGAHGLRGLLHYANQQHLRPELLDLRNSGDTAGDKSQVVGYAAFAFLSETRA